jgi:hypothetical protein
MLFVRFSRTFLTLPLSFAVALDRRMELELNMVSNANLPSCVACTFPSSVFYVDGSQESGFVVRWGVFEHDDKVLTQSVTHETCTCMWKGPAWNSGHGAVVSLISESSCRYSTLLSRECFKFILFNSSTSDHAEGCSFETSTARK